MKNIFRLFNRMNRITISEFEKKLMKKGLSLSDMNLPEIKDGFGVYQYFIENLNLNSGFKDGRKFFEISGDYIVEIRLGKIMPETDIYRPVLARKIPFFKFICKQ